MKAKFYFWGRIANKKASRGDPAEEKRIRSESVTRCDRKKLNYC